MDDELMTTSIMEWAEVFMRLSMRDFTRYTRSAGLSLAQMNVLMYLYYQGPTEVMSFAHYMDLSPAGASQLIDRMVQQRLVSRQTSSTDRRVRIVVMEEQGRSVVEAGLIARRRWMQDLLSLMNNDDKKVIAAALRVLTDKARQFTKEDN